MPVPLLKLGQESNKALKKLDAEYAGQAKNIFLDLDQVLVSRAERILKQLFRGDEIVWAEYALNKKHFLDMLTERVDEHYEKVAKVLTVAERRIFVLMRETLMGHLEKLYPLKKETRSFNLNRLMEMSLEEARKTDVPLVEQERVVLNIGQGGVSKEFQHYLKSQLQVGERPADLIRTMSANQIKLTQEAFMRAVEGGFDLRKSSEAVLGAFRSEITSESFKTPTQFEVMRVLRESHTQAARASTAYFAQENAQLVSGFRRMAGGRACACCAALDGTLYDDPTQFDDHINGMCLLVPELKTLGEMGIPYRPEYEAAWRRELPPVPSLSSEFYGASEAVQRQLFNNNALYDLWKQERFPLDKLVTLDKAGRPVPIALKDAMEKVHTWGGVSAPKVGLADMSGVKDWSPDSEFLRVLDPKDRATGEMVAMRKVDAVPGLTNEFGQSLFGMGTDGSVPIDVQNRARVLLAATSPDKATWYDFNAYARELGLWTRKATDGSVYWVVPKGSLDDVIRGQL